MTYDLKAARAAEFRRQRLRDTAYDDMLAVLKDLPDIIKDFDGGNPETETGWASEEMLDLWMRVNAAIAKAEGTS
jgi:hypothetical protein